MHHSKWIWTNPNTSGVWMIRVYSNWSLWPFIIQRDTKDFSDWFGMIHNGLETEFVGKFLLVGIKHIFFIVIYYISEFRKGVLCTQRIIFLEYKL